MDARRTTLFLCGDVMTGRGIDQALPHPCDPTLREPWIADARDYITLAEQRYGPFARPLAPAEIWGDLLVELARSPPDARIVNLETSITRDGEFWRDKEVHYRMAPENAACLAAAKIDVATLANNHVLDFGRGGLLDTLDTLERAGVRVAGAGRNREEAERPAILDREGARIVVFAFGVSDSGVPRAWQATAHAPGVEVLRDLSAATADAIVERVGRTRRHGDLVIASIHWGSNWGFEVDPDHVRFAHRLVEGGVDVVHGHSSHHVRPLEVYGDRLILYGCGDFLNDYEGIRGYEEFRGDLAVAWLPTLDPATGELVSLAMTPFRIRHFRLHRAPPEDAAWLKETLARLSPGAPITLGDDARLAL